MNGSRELMIFSRKFEKGGGKETELTEIEYRIIYIIMDLLTSSNLGAVR